VTIFYLNLGVLVMNYVTIDNIKIQVTNISQDPQLVRPSTQIIGGGSSVEYHGSGGRLLEITAFATGDEYPQLESLWKKNKRVSLISQSKAKYNGFYHILSFTHVEYKKQRFTINMKLQEDFTFKITKKNFIDYNVKIIHSAVEVKVGGKWNTES
jgi:hypothetical protein